MTGEPSELEQNLGKIATKSTELIGSVEAIAANSAVLAGHADALATMCHRLIRERDEARREVCEIQHALHDNCTTPADGSTAQDVAVTRGWDCYEETL